MGMDKITTFYYQRNRTFIQKCFSLYDRSLIVIFLQTITENKKHFLAECYLTHLTAEPINNTVGYDTVRDRNEYMNIFCEKIYRRNSPQIAVWNHLTQKVSKLNYCYEAVLFILITTRFKSKHDSSLPCALFLCTAR